MRQDLLGVGAVLWGVLDSAMAWDLHQAAAGRLSDRTGTAWAHQRQRWGRAFPVLVAGMVVLAPLVYILVLGRMVGEARMLSRDSRSKLEEYPPANKEKAMGKDTPYCGERNNVSGARCSENEGHDSTVLAKDGPTPHTAPASNARESAVVWTDPNTEPPVEGQAPLIQWPRPRAQALKTRTPHPHPVRGPFAFVTLREGRTPRRTDDR